MAWFSLPDCRWSLFMSVPRRSFSLLFSVSVRPCSVTRPSVFHLLGLISRRASPEPRPSARPAVCSFARPGAQSDIKFYWPCCRSAHSPPLIHAPRSPPLPAGLPLALSHFHPAGIHRPSCLARSNLRLRAPARLFCVLLFRCGAAICFTDRPLSGAQARIAPAWFPLSPASLSFPLVPSSECFRTLVTFVFCYMCRPARFSTPRCSVYRPSCRSFVFPLLVLLSHAHSVWFPAPPAERSPAQPNTHLRAPTVFASVCVLSGGGRVRGSCALCAAQPVSPTKASGRPRALGASPAPTSACSRRQSWPANSSRASRGWCCSCSASPRRPPLKQASASWHRSEPGPTTYTADRQQTLSFARFPAHPAAFSPGRAGPCAKSVPRTLLAVAASFAVPLAALVRQALSSARAATSTAVPGVNRQSLRSLPVEGASR